MNTCASMNSTEDVQNCAYNVNEIYKMKQLKCHNKCECKIITCDQKQFKDNKDKCNQMCEEQVDNMFS